MRPTLPQLLAVIGPVLVLGAGWSWADSLPPDNPTLQSVLDGTRGTAPAILLGNSVSIASVDEEALVKILVEPRNSLSKQYKRLFELDGVKLEFTADALRAAARRALELKTGARGLRAIMEEAMLEVMYELPGQDNVAEVVVNEESITNGAYPIIGLKSEAASA